MKILIFSYQFPPAKGGIPYSNLEIAKGLKRLGNDVLVLCSKQKESVEFTKNIGFKVGFLPKWSFTPMPSFHKKAWPNWVLLPIYFVLINRYIIKFKPDILLVTDETSNAFWGAISFCSTDIKYISYCSVPILSLLDCSTTTATIKGLIGLLIRLFFRAVIYKSYRDASVLLAVSNSTKQSLSEKYPVLEKKISIVPRSIDDLFFTTDIQRKTVDELRQQYNIGGDDVVILSVSRLLIDKGIDDVIKAISQLEAATLKRIKYLVVGEGDDAQKLKQIVSDLQLDESVFFVGGVIHEKLISYYDVCDFFALPSRTGVVESFGRVFVEAAARKKTSIGVKDGGMKDIIEDGRNGFLVEKGDVVEIRKKIEFFACKEELMKKMGMNAFVKAEQYYTSRKVASMFEDHVRNLLERRSGSSPGKYQLIS